MFMPAKFEKKVTELVAAPLTEFMKPQPKTRPDAVTTADNETVGGQLSSLIKFLHELDSIAPSENLEKRSEWEEYTTNLTVSLCPADMAAHLESLDADESDEVLNSANRIIGLYHAMGNQQWTGLPCFSLVSEETKVTLIYFSGKDSYQLSVVQTKNCLCFVVLGMLSRQI